MPLRVYRTLPEAGSEVGPEARPCAVSIGNFDGVHLGHRSIFRRIVALGRERGWKPSVLTFDPHPTRVVAPERAPKLLTTLEERLDLMAAEGIEQAFVLPFDKAFSEQSPESFVRDVLISGLGAKAALVGDNFRFGKGQAGNVALLRELGARYGFLVEVATGTRVRGRMVSSSELRRLVMSGEVALARRLLARPYSIRGKIVRGQGIGSKQTVPTLNLATEAEVLPATGVYITRTREIITRTREIGGTREWNSITNVGYRPTFEGEGLTVETFLLSSLKGDTPERIQLEFLRRVREERKFETPEALKAQILRDVGRANVYFRRCGRLAPELHDKIES